MTVAARGLGSAAARRAALEEAEKVRLQLFTLGSDGGVAVEGTTRAAFDFAEGTLDASPAQLVQGWMAMWVRSFDAQAKALAGVFETLTDPPPRPRKRNDIEGGVITFYLDQYSQAADPVETTIPKTEAVTASDLVCGEHRILCRHVVFTGPSRDAATTYSLSLAGLDDVLWDLPEGDYTGSLRCSSGRSEVVKAVVAHAT